MRHPDIYWPTRDAIAPQPENVHFIFDDPEVWTVAALWDGHIIGYVQFIRKTSIGAEVHTAFMPEFRGKPAKAIGQFAIAKAFTEKALLKLWAPIPSDNRPAMMAARLMGFRVEGRLTRAIIRGDSRWGKAGIYDMVLFSLNRGDL